MDLDLISKSRVLSFLSAPFAFKAMEEGAVQMMDQNLDSLGSGEVTLTASKSVATSGVASSATVFVAALLSMAVAAMMA